MEIVEKRSINDSKQNFFLGLYKYYQICFENRLSWELSGMEAVLQADWSVKGLLTGTNFVVCSYGKFQPGRPGWNSRNKTNMVKHKLVSFATVIALWTLLNLLIKLIRTLLKWKYIHCKNYAILAAMMRKRSYFVKKSFVSVTRAGVFTWENFHPGYRDLGRKNRDLGNRDSPSAHLNTSKFLRRKDWRGEISETEPARLTGLIWRGPKLTGSIWKS